MNREHLDCLIIGAGISGICAAYYFQKNFPSRTYAIVEARESLGGTWDLFRYPGIRSDSDMFTLGFSFRPWSGPKPVAEGPKILQYLRDTAAELGIDRRIRYGERVTRISWSTKAASWTVEITNAKTGSRQILRCNFLLMCTGYYDGDEGYTPEFPGADRFLGRVVHPQHWTSDIEYANKRVVVIGSGATAVSLLPALAQDAASVTMLQRSPTYIVSLPNHDGIWDKLRKLLSTKSAAIAMRWKNVLLNLGAYLFMRRFPDRAKELLLKQVRQQLGNAADTEQHFTPTYKPWDQRLCLVPDGDLFVALREGRAAVVTDHIETFTEKGLRLRSGKELEADLIVTATGLKLRFLGGIKVEIDGVAKDLTQSLLYRGVMCSGVPNLACVLGYQNASWTLRAELACQYICRLLTVMDRRGYTKCQPPEDPGVEKHPVFSLSAGYIQRAQNTFPQQGAEAPWRMVQNYLSDRSEMNLAQVDDGVLEFSRKR